MGHIKEPAGVDLIIDSRPLTKEEEVAISEYIRAYKKKHAQVSVLAKRKRPTAKRKKDVA